MELAKRGAGHRLAELEQEIAALIKSFPHLPLWMALSAVLPVTWSPILVYFGITLILGMIEWTHLARAVRSKLLALREEDFCTAAVLMGATPARIIGRHLLPSFMSHLIASATLVIPSMILGETALSFLGLGLRPPITSWGVLLNEAQNISVVALYPWLMFPVVPVIVTVLAFNFVLYDVLAGGASRSLRIDSQGKTLALALLQMSFERPTNVAAMRRPSGGEKP